MEMDYRPMGAEEVPAVLRFWSQGSAVSYAYQAARLASDPAATTHTYVAVAADGTIAATIHYHLAQRRTATGLPHLMGEIDSVGTRPDLRRQGHAQRLLQLVMTALEREGCAWALLNTTEMGRALYERQEWRYFPEPWRRGTVVQGAPAPTSPYFVRPFDPRGEPAGWERIATVDMAYNHARPLTVVRTPPYWRAYAALRIGHWIDTEGLMLFAAFRSAVASELCGYATGEFNPGMFFQIRDLAVLPSEPTAILPLLHAVAQEAQRRGDPPVGRVFLPNESASDAALEQFFGATLEQGQNLGFIMARTIGAQFTDRELDALFAAPGAFLSCIDGF